jgi:putative transposase
MRRRQLRLRGYDYSAPGLYFVTACTQRRACILGRVLNDAVVLTSAGVAARDCLIAVPRHYGGVHVDSFIVMPNHVHAILEVRQRRVSLGVIVGTFKAAVTRSTGRARVWQRGYYEHVVRDEADLERIRDYIVTNPAKWALDPDNPANEGS